MKNTWRYRSVAGVVACLMLAATSSLLPDHQAQQQPVLVLTHTNIIDGESREPIRDATIIIRQGRIEQIAARTVEVPPSATIIDLRGRWVLPGFVDAHVHIGTMAAARTALRSGVTTARSLGVSHFADVGLRELHRAGVADLPDIIAAGYHVRPRPADEFFLDLPTQSDLMSGVTGPVNVRRMVRALIERGVDTIKIMATERAGLPETDPRKRVYSEEELVAAVEEARRLGRTVAAHAHGDEGARAAVRAGVRTIEHGTYLSTETLALMRERGTCLVPTIATVVDLTDPGGDYDNPLLAVRGRAMLPRVRETTARAWKMGVRIIAGTDTGYGPASIRRMPHEVIELAALGMSPLEAIRAATSVAAACLGVDQRTGTIRPGLEADLIVVDADPLADITALQDILLVINDGVIVLNRLAE